MTRQDKMVGGPAMPACVNYCASFHFGLSSDSWHEEVVDDSVSVTRGK